MDITIDDVGSYAPTMFDNVPRRLILPKIQRKHTQKTLTKTQLRAIERYKDAYKKVFAVSPTIKVQGKWYRIHGVDYGVSLKRLNEMTTQLEFRHG